MRWFGRDWGAPVCRVEAKMRAPVGERCAICKRKIQPGDRGIALEVDGYVWHVDCFVDGICHRKPGNRPSMEKTR